MGVATIYLLVIAYMVGLLMTAWSDTVTLLGGLAVGTIVMPLAGLLLAGIMPRLWRMGPRSLAWMMAGLIGVGAGWYLQWRSPSYEALLSGIPLQQQPSFPQPAQIQGRVLNAPRLTRGQRVKFILGVDALQLETPDLPSVSDEDGAIADADLASSDLASPNLASFNAVTHKVYATIPLLQGTGLYPGAAVQLEGRLYRPQAAAIPGAFDFQQYLERDGIFVGFSGELQQVSHYRSSIRPTDPSSWQEIGRSVQQATWQIRQRIIRSFVQGLNSPAGPLLAGMVLGRKAVDLPYEVSDQFIQAGLAHVLAASGFHVSLLLGLVLTLGRSLSPSKRLWLGSLTLVGYVSLTGLQPSVCRAALLGLAVLVTAVQERQLKPVGALVMIAALLLLWNPQWIFDLGFQLSFLATLGLVVTVPWLSQKLDWLPPAVAGAIAVPIAAMIWTLPILLRTMGTILPYSPLLSVVTTPLIIVISLGGMVTGAIAILLPPIGSGLAWLFYWPIHGLMAMVAGFNHLPGQAIALGTISTGQLILIYALYGFTLWAGSDQTVLPKLQRPMVRWSTILALLTGLVVPIAYSRFHTTTITCLAASQYRQTTPLMVIQNRGRVGLINTGSDADIQYKLLPFLRHQGINRIDWAIATTPTEVSTSRWIQLNHTVPLSHLYPLSPPIGDVATAALTTDVVPTPAFVPQNGLPPIVPRLPHQRVLGPDANLTLISTTPLIIQLTLDGQVWLVIPNGLLQVGADENLGNVDMSDQETRHRVVGVTPLPLSDVWYWPGWAIAPDIESQVVPHAPHQAIITAATPASLPTVALPPVYQLDTHEAIQWQGNRGWAIAPEAVNHPE
ncbi:MAG: ComEC/Rec2 family competence protein [Leptolyngbyaceae cyanobacterium]